MTRPAHLRPFAAVLFLALLAVSCGGTDGSRPRRRPVQREFPAMEEVSPGLAGESRISPEDEIDQEARSRSDRRFPPPDPPSVARRALILRSLGIVGSYPRATDRASPEAVEKFEVERERMVAWLRREGLWSSASAEERVYLSSPVGTRLPGKIQESYSPAEALEVMLWALGSVHRISEYDKPARNFATLSGALPPVGPSTRAFLERARSRPRVEIEHEQAKADVWHARACAGEVIARKRFPQGKELGSLRAELEETAAAADFPLRSMKDGKSYLEELIRFTARDAFSRGLTPPLIDGDFPALGKSYASLPEDQLPILERIAEERLRAFNWLLGASGDWDSVPLDL